MAVLSVSGRPWMRGMLAVCGLLYVAVFVFAFPMESSSFRRLSRRPRPSALLSCLPYSCASRLRPIPSSCDGRDEDMKRVLAVSHCPLVRCVERCLHAHRLRRCRKNPWRSCACSRERALAKFDNKRTELRLFHRLRSGTSWRPKPVRGSYWHSLLAIDTNSGKRLLGLWGVQVLTARREKSRNSVLCRRWSTLRPSREKKSRGHVWPRPGSAPATDQGKSISNLYPSEGAATVAETALLRFDAVEGYQKYKLELEDETGNAVFSVETAATTVQILAGVLRQGASTTGGCEPWIAEKPAMRGEAVFSTLNRR